jgi:hypothetical protein
MKIDKNIYMKKILAVFLILVALSMIFIRALVSMLFMGYQISIFILLILGAYILLKEKW